MSNIDFYNHGFWGPERNLQVSLRYSWEAKQTARQRFCQAD